MNEIPIILIAIANGNESYLDNLKQEVAHIQDALKQAVNQNICEIVIIEKTTIDKLFSAFRNPKYRNRISIFHYAGHANSYSLLLETEAGGNQKASSKGLVPFLAREDSIQLIFLNGCSTEQQAKELIDEGIPAVIGTSESVADTIAMNLSKRFYHSIGVGLDIAASWKDAENEIKMSFENKIFRSLDLHKNNSFEGHPWDLYIRKGAEQVNKWNLPDASNNPLFRLPKINKKYYESLPYPPFRYLQYYTKNDAAIFFGRGYEIRSLFESIHKEEESIILLYGQSGVGKSSLLNAGLIPYIESQFSVIYLRRDDNIGLSKTLVESINVGDSRTCIKPLLIILDQVEEFSTKPLNSTKDELGDLIYEIRRSIFNNSRFNGKLILSYRKEYHADIENRLRENYISYESIYLEPLDKNGIIEAVQGLEKNIKTRKYYNYSVEGSKNGRKTSELATIIADDLLEDRNSPIAALLQIYLSKLWEKASRSQGRGGRVEFSVSEYHSISKGGLNDFFEEQISLIEKENPYAVSSGLVLELLKEYTTEYGTAKSCDIAFIEKSYKHCSNVTVLQNQLIDAHLLSRYDKNSNILSHDTLGIIILSNYSSSDKKAQRARRILDNRIVSWKQKNVNILDDYDLMEVKNGLTSIKKLTSSEKNLIEQSSVAKIKREKARVFRKRLGISAVFTITGIAIIAVIFFFQANEERKRALTQINTANELISYIQSTLRDELQKVGRLDIMSDTQKAIDKYTKESLAVVDGTTDKITIKNRRQTIANNIDNAYIMFRKGRDNEALEVLKKALKETKAIVKLIPNDLRWKSNIGVIHLKMAEIYKKQRRFDLSLSSCLISFDLVNELLESDPDNNMFKRDLVSNYESLGDYYNDLNKYNEAISIYSQAIDYINVDYNGSDNVFLKNIFKGKIAQIYKRKSDRNESFCIENKCLDKSIEMYLTLLKKSEDLVLKNPNDSLIYWQMVNTLYSIAVTYSAKKDYVNSHIYYQLTVEKGELLVKNNPKHIEYSRVLSMARKGLFITQSFK